MKLEIQIDEKYEETKIIIQGNKMNKEISDLIQNISKVQENFKVFLGEETYFIKEEDIESIYSENGKVYIKTSDNKYLIKNRLYELEEILSKNKFVRISNSEIINFSKVEKINTKVLGTIYVHFFSGYETYVSRRFISRVKEFLNV